MSELDPQAKALLKQIQARIAQRSAPEIPPSPLEKILIMRQAMGSIGALSFPSEPVSRIKEFEIPGPAGRIPARMYVPHTQGLEPSVASALIFFHAGGFVAGNPASPDTLLRALANRAQCLVLSVGYRLAPENPYPAANEDAWAAVTWVAGHAAEIGVDPRRLAVGGESSGGLLAAWVAQRAAKKGPSLRLQVLHYPNLDASTSRPSWKELGGGDYIFSRSQMTEWLDAYLPKGIDRKDPKVSPLYTTDLSGVAPAFIATAEYDPLRDEGNEYADRLKAANIAVDHTCWPGMVHGFASNYGGVIDAGKALIDQTGAALRKAFQ